MFDCFIFDVDGTLLDTKAATLGSLRRLLYEAKGVDYRGSRLEAEFGRPGHATLADLGIEDIPAATSLWGSYIAAWSPPVAPFAGVLETVSELKRLGKRLGIVTSRRREELLPDLARFGLGRLIDGVVCADDTRRHKPDPEPLLAFLRASPVAREKSVYIGDMGVDARCAASAETAFCLAAWGDASGEEGGALGLPCLRRFGRPGEILDLA
jgi:phosphoglycolate phosphatase-like HAD superfamily hydrolase